MTVMEAMRRVTAQPLGEAEALPFDAYRDPDYFDVEQRAVFARDWVFACMAADLPEPGDYHALQIADEPVIVMRGADGELRALSNVCRHRGAVMLEGSGRIKKRIVCPYHAWAYSDAGALKGVPFPGEVEVDKQSHGLRRFKLGVWCGLVFVSLNDDAPALEDRFRGLERYFGDYRVETYTHTMPIQVTPWRANWKLAIENFVEGYHFFAVHRKTVETAAPTRDCFYVEGNADWSVTGGTQLAYGSSFIDLLRLKSPKVHYLSIHVPPNLVVNLYEGYMGWMRVLPTGPTACETAGGFCAVDGRTSLASRVAGWLFDFDARISAEDRAICENVQRGIRSTRGKGGRLVELERAVVNFHQYLGKRLFDLDHSTHFRTEYADRMSG